MITDDPNHPGINKPTVDGQHEAYLVLPVEERMKGFIRPVRTAYMHVTCGAVTNMGIALSQTYARDPKFYGATYCASCGTHFPVAQFRWTEDNTIVGS